MKNHEKIAYLNGKVEIRNNDIILKYDNKERVLDFINTYITQFPANRETIDLLIDISLKGKNIFIGTYGNQRDKNMNCKLKELYEKETKSVKCDSGYFIGRYLLLYNIASDQHTRDGILDIYNDADISCYSVLCFPKK